MTRRDMTDPALVDALAHLIAKSHRDGSRVKHRSGLHEPTILLDPESPRGRAERSRVHRSARSNPEEKRTRHLRPALRSRVALPSPLRSLRAKLIALSFILGLGIGIGTAWRIVSPAPQEASRHVSEVATVSVSGSVIANRRGRRDAREVADWRGGRTAVQVGDEVQALERIRVVAQKGIVEASEAK